MRLVLEDGKTVGAARGLDLTKTALREWVRRAQAARTRGGRVPRPESARSWRGCGNHELRMERNILKNAAAFLAKHQQ